MVITFVSSFFLFSLCIWAASHNWSNFIMKEHSWFYEISWIIFSPWLFECFRNVSWKFKRLIIEIDFVIEQVFKNYFFPLWIYKCMHSHSRMRSSFQCCNIGYFLLATFYFFWRFNVFYFRWILNIIRKCSSLEKHIKTWQ